MNWFNYYGLIFMVIILIPNIIFAVTNRNNNANKYKNKVAEILEQIGRFACLIFMVFNVPYTFLGFYFPFAEIVYVALNSVFILIYCLGWVILWKKSGIVKALLLSIIPSAVFLFSGIMIASVPLITFACLFAAAHILISVKNAS